MIADKRAVWCHHRVCFSYVKENHMLFPLHLPPTSFPPLPIPLPSHPLSHSLRITVLLQRRSRASASRFRCSSQRLALIDMLPARPARLWSHPKSSALSDTGATQLVYMCNRAAVSPGSNALVGSILWRCGPLHKHRQHYHADRRFVPILVVALKPIKLIHNNVHLLIHTSVFR